MIYPKPTDKYSCEVFCQNFEEIENRLQSVEGGGSDFLVTFTLTSGDTATADKTFAETIAAYTEGKSIYFKVASGYEHLVFMPVGFYPDAIIGSFVVQIGGDRVEQFSLIFISDDTVELATNSIAMESSIPTTLPNPQALNFTGAVTGVYDGSEPLTVNIPEPSSGERGEAGKSAYQYAVEGGYTGTEEEFAAKMAEEFPTSLKNPNALTFAGAVTGSYDGSEALTVNIPSGGGDFIINISDRGVADKTFEEAMEAHNAGKKVYFKIDDAGLLLANTFSADDAIMASMATGLALSDDPTYLLCVVILASDNKIYQYMGHVALLTDIPSTLPNPKTLTFTGAAMGTYDGSEALMINIPEPSTVDLSNYYNKEEIDALFGTNLTEVASLIGGDA